VLTSTVLYIIVFFQVAYYLLNLSQLFEAQDCVNILIFKILVCTSKKIHFYITKVIWLILSEEITAVYTESETKPINAICEAINFKPCGSYSYHWTLEG
jgi:hypothetical protein